MIKLLKEQISKYKKRRAFTSFYSQFVNRGDLCFDIGANIGNRTEIFLKIGARVVSIEPVEKTFQILKNKFENQKNATLLQIGIGSIKGTMEINISNISEVCTYSELFIEQYKNQENFDIKWDRIQSTEIKTLDQLIADYGIPSFCKIDVEGYELEVLNGLSQPIPMISFEYNAKLKNLALDCITKLSEHKSLTFNFSPYETMDFYLPSWKNQSEFYQFISELPESIKTGDIYVKHN
jgi:FkbM family methyltransferase